MIADGRAGPTMSRGRAAQPTAEAVGGRYPGFSSFNVLARGPGSLAER